MNKELETVRNKFKDTGIKLNISKKVLNQLYDKCYSPEYGARFAQRLITTDVEDVVIDYLITKNITFEDSLIQLSMSVEDGKFVCKQEERVA